MITGLHSIIYAKDADKVRAFLRDVLGLKFVDAGHGWLIFAAPPAELAAHPVDEGKEPFHELYLMCDDLKATMADLQKKGVRCGAGRPRRPTHPHPAGTGRRAAAAPAVAESRDAAAGRE